MENVLTIRRPRGGWLLSLLAVLAVLAVPAPTHGQTEVGTLTIQVVEASAATPIAEALVTARNLDSGLSQMQKTGANGEAVFRGIEPGRYEVRVSHPDFVERLIPDPTNDRDDDDQPVNVAPSGSIALRLELAPRIKIADAVPTVVGPPTLTPNAGLAHEVTSARQRELLDLPNLNTDITPLLTVVPGAVATGSASLGRVVIDGRGKEQQTFRLDGVDASTLAELPSGDPTLGVLDSFQRQSVTALDQAQSSVVSGAFGPLNGPGTGASTESVTVRGGLPFKFQFYDLFRNDALDARNFFDFDGKNAIRRNQFGGKVAGPLSGGGKAFFFFGYEGIRGRTERNLYEAVPADAACCGTGPLLEGFLPPGTGIVGPSTNPAFLVARRRARIESEANAWNLRLDFLPFAVEGVTDSEERSAKNQFSFRFTRQAGESLVPDGVTGRLQRQRVLFANGFLMAKLFTANYTHDLKLGFNKTRGMVDIERGATTSPALAQALVTVGGTAGVNGLPGNPSTVPVAALGGLSRGVGRGFDLNPHSVTASYNINRSFGDAHELNTGGEVRFIRFRFNRLGGLTYSFPDVAALRAGTPGGVTLVSDLSDPGPFGHGGAGVRRAAQEYYMGYFQMRSKYWFSAPATSDPRLTLTYGLRYDYFGPVRERDDRAVVVDPQTGEIIPPGAPFYRASKNNFEPRFGLVYVPPVASGPFARTTIRAGAGIYLGVPRIGDLVLPVESDRFSTGVTGGAFPADRAAIISGFVDDADTRQFQPLAFARDFTTPERVYKWEASLSRRVGAFGDLRTSYVGNVGRNLPLAGIANPIVDVFTNTDPTQPAVVVRQFDLVRDGQVFKPFGEFFYRTSDGRSSYNALTLSLQRDETKHGIPRSELLRFASFRLQYTLSRNVGNVTGAPTSDPTNFDADYGYNASDARHSFTFSLTYKLWEAFKQPRGSVLWGWTLAPMFTARSGLPLTVRLDRPDVVYLDASGNVFASPGAGRTAVINTPGGGATGGTRVPDLLPGVDPFLRSGLELLNPAAFAIPEPGRFGNLRRGALRGPSSYQLDLAVTRQFFDKRESNAISADFKVEFINLLNHANFNNPLASLPNVLGTNFSNNQLQPGMAFPRPAAGAFGIINAADPGRQIQFSVNIKFNEGF